MAEKSQYQTRQRLELVEYMRNHCDGWLCSRDIIDEPSLDIGEATVYRILNRLAEEGIIEKKSSENGRGALYRYCGTADCHGHIHLRCLVCDHTICLHSHELQQAEQVIGSELGFSVDESRSTLYGICSGCKKAGAEKGDSK